MWLLYQIAMAAILALAAPYLLARRGKHYLATLPGRLGRHPPPSHHHPLWLHAVSVGEVSVAATLAKALPSSLPLLVTTVTPTGQARARELFADGRATVTYLPFDLGFAVRRFYDRFQPAALVLVEGDYWPLVLREATLRHLPVAVANGRVSQRSFARLARLRFAAAPLFSAVGCFGMQTADDRQRLIELGVEPRRLHVTGNLKYDTPEPPARPQLEATVRQLAAGRPILVAGSTMAGEEEAVLDAYADLGGGGTALLVLAPRHPERNATVARLIADRGLDGQRRSQLAEDHDTTPEVLLLDTLGELAGLYRLATAAFIGGTLVATGGHNPLEPARFAVPTAVGPSMDNFLEMAEQFDRMGAWARVEDAAALARTWRSWLENPAIADAVGSRAAELVATNRGAARRTRELLEPLLANTKAPSP